jgi:hypothetical protein
MSSSQEANARRLSKELLEALEAEAQRAQLEQATAVEASLTKAIYRWMWMNNTRMIQGHTVELRKLLSELGFSARRSPISSAVSTAFKQRWIPTTLPTRPKGASERMLI